MKIFLNSVAGFFVSLKNKVGGLTNKIRQRGWPAILVKLFGSESKIRKFFTPRRLTLIKKGVFCLVVVAAIIQVVFAVLIYGFHKDDKVTRILATAIPYPVAVANYGIITYHDYLKEKDYIHHFYAATKQENIDLKEIDKQIMEQLIENHLLASQAKRYGVEVKNSEIDEALNTIIEQNGGQEKVAKVLNDLYGLNVDQFKSLVRNQLLRDKINTDLIMKVTVRHILIRVDKDASEDKVNETKSKIESLRKEIAAGADFGETAKKNSEDVGSNEQGGSLEPFARGEMVDAFSDAAFTLNIGELSQPVRTDFGWHIIKLEAKQGKIDRKFADWLTDLVNKALVLKFVKP